MRPTIWAATVLAGATLAAWGGTMKEELEGAKSLSVERACIPVQTARHHNSILVANADRQTYDLLVFYEARRQTEAFIIELATGEVKKEMLPAGYSNPWGTAVARDGRLFMGLWGPGAMLVYDPASNRLTDLGKVTDDRATESVSLGTDGKIYVGTFSRVTALQIDPETLKVTSYGVQGPKRNYMGYAYSIAADDGYVYTASGKIPWCLVAYNKKTGEQQSIVQGSQDDYISVGQGRDGCTGSHSIGSGPEKGVAKQYWLYQGKAIPRKPEDKTPPWPARAQEAAAPAEARPELFLDRAVPGPDGRAEVWYRTAEDKAAAKGAPADAPPERSGWKMAELKVDVAPMGIRRLSEMPDGRLIGTVEDYQGHFLYDPAKGECTYLGRIGLSHYGTAMAGGKVYLTGYPSSPVFEYDPSREWTPGRGLPGKPAPGEAAEGSNPRRLLYMAPLLQTHYLRFAVTGADGKIYAGGHCERSHVGGALGWWDPKEQKAGGLREPFKSYDVAWVCTALEGRRVVYSSFCVADPARNNYIPEQAKLFVFDVEKGEIALEVEPVPGLRNTGMVAEGAPGKVLAAAANPKGEGTSLLYQVDLGSGKVEFVREVPARFDGDYRKGPDGAIWTFLGETLVRIMPETGEIRAVGKVGRAGRIAFVGKDVYLAGDVYLRRVAGVVGGPAEAGVKAR